MRAQVAPGVWTGAGRLAGFMIIFLVSASSGCVSWESTGTTPVEPQFVDSAKRFKKVYVLAPGDEIEVFVRRVPEVSRKCVVRPDGQITLPLVDDVQAAGLTPPELDDELTARLSEKLVDVEVTVIANSVRQPRVYVLGEVMAPSPVSLRDASTPAQAIAHAGGFKLRSAASDFVAVVRMTDDGHIRAYRLKPAVGGQPGWYMALNSMLLEPDDLIVVPESGRSQFVRFVEDFINTPLTGLNQAISPYLQFKLIDELQKQRDLIERQR